MSQEIVMLHHATPASNLPKILASGSLLSRELLGIAPDIYHPGMEKYVFLTPWTTTEFRRTRTDSILHLDAKAVMAAYPRFFINNGNQFGPGDGQKNRALPETADCGCEWTYNTLTPVEGPCVKKTLKEIESVLKYNMDDCDNGPEIGFPDKIEILPFLKGITLSEADYESIKDKVPPELKSLLLKNPKGGRRRSTRRARRSRKQKRRSRRV